MSRKTELELAVALLDKQLSLISYEIDPQVFPLGPGSAHDAHIMENIDQLGIEALIQLQNLQLDRTPNDPYQMYQDYVQQRKTLNIFHEQIYEAAFEELESISLELGNYDLVYEVPVIQNEAERNLIHDYSVLYRSHPSGQRFVTYWVSQHLKEVADVLEPVLQQFLEARFAMLRIDKKVAHGVMHVTDMVTGHSFIFIDKAVFETGVIGIFFICSIITMDNYSMTTGGGIPIDAKSLGGRATLSLFLKHRAALTAFSLPVSQAYRHAVQSIYGFCLRNSALAHHTPNNSY